MALWSDSDSGSDRSAVREPPINGASPRDTAGTVRRLERLPREVGALLLVAGLTSGMLPPPPGPFDLMITLSGALVLWPRGFRTVRGWGRRRFPRAHDAGMAFLDRYLDDLERRYPNSADAGE